MCSLKRAGNCEALQYVPHELQKEALEVVKSSPQDVTVSHGLLLCCFGFRAPHKSCLGARKAVAQLERSTTIAGIAFQLQHLAKTRPGCNPWAWTLSSCSGEVVLEGHCGVVPGVFSSGMSTQRSRIESRALKCSHV